MNASSNSRGSVASQQDGAVRSFSIAMQLLCLSLTPYLLLILVCNVSQCLHIPILQRHRLLCGVRSLAMSFFSVSVLVGRVCLHRL
jgi:hypothetical protein